jgi:hypothetical protein
VTAARDFSNSCLHIELSGEVHVRKLLLNAGAAETKGVSHLPNIPTASEHEYVGGKDFETGIHAGCGTITRRSQLISSRMYADLRLDMVSQAAIRG